MKISWQTACCGEGNQIIHWPNNRRASPLQPPARACDPSLAICSRALVIKKSIFIWTSCCASVPVVPQTAPVQAVGKVGSAFDECEQERSYPGGSPAGAGKLRSVLRIQGAARMLSLMQPLLCPRLESEHSVPPLAHPQHPPGGCAIPGHIPGQGWAFPAPSLGEPSPEHLMVFAW